MGQNIKSNNQKGGITAGTINSNTIHQNNITKGPIKKTKWYNNPWIIGIICGSIFLILGIVLT